MRDEGRLGIDVNEDGGAAFGQFDGLVGAILLCRGEGDMGWREVGGDVM